MGRWRTKMLFSLILYSAGFATAVYVLSPSPANASNGAKVCERSKGSNLGTEEAGFSSQDWAIKMRAGMDTVKDLAEENAVKGVQAVKAWVDQRRQGNGQ
jgi:hypothetical protein